MSRRSFPPRRRPRRGFTFIEALVSITVLVIIMVATLSLLVGMQAFAQRQQTYTAPRQSARGALDYLSFFVEGAGDLNINQPGQLTNPNALLMYYVASGKGAGRVQASYDNVTPAQKNLADPGTDIITLAIPDSPVIAPIINWPGFNHAATMWVRYTAGCNGTANQDQNNLWMFQQATGATPLLAQPNTDNKAISGLLTVVGDNGAWHYFVIDQYLQSDCSATDGQNIHIDANPGLSDFVDPPGGRPDLMGQNPRIVCGVNFRSFRVKDGQLQQKNGMFDPAVDATAATTFFPIAENIEDLQIAYVYGQGGQAGIVWNSGHFDPADPLNWMPSRLADKGVANGIPEQAGPGGAATQWDITNVIGIRLSLTARSLPLALSSLKLTDLRSTNQSPFASHHYRPPSEDRDMDRDAKNAPLFDVDRPGGVVFDHIRLTTTLMLRNRILGS